MDNQALLDQAKKAIRHTLRTICDDPRKFWLLGSGTQTYSLLTDADDLLNGKAPQKKSGLRTHPYWQPDAERYAEYLKQKEEEDEGNLGKATAPNLLDAVLEERMECICERLNRLALMELRKSHAANLIEEIKDIVKEELTR